MKHTIRTSTLEQQGRNIRRPRSLLILQPPGESLEAYALTRKTALDRGRTGRISPTHDLDLDL